jgi:purine-binding chemotaxis protein CheW
MNAAIAGQVVVFRVEGQRLALPLEQVERATRSVAITPLPHAPSIVIGIIDLHGVVVPVIDLRRRLQLPACAPTLNDQILIIRTSKHLYAAQVDAVLDVVKYASSDFASAATIVPGLEYLQGVVSLPDGIILIHDFEHFLSLEENQILDKALNHV